MLEKYLLYFWLSNQEEGVLMMKNILNIFTLSAILVLAGCEAGGQISIEHTREQAPPIVTGGSGGSSTSTTIKTSGSICTPNHPLCQKPSKEEVNNKIRDFNLVLQQTNTYSTPINQKVLIEVMNVGNVVSSQVFNTTVVGNQIRIANPAQAADWLYSELDYGTSVQISLYLQSSGFSSEIVTAQVRHGSNVISAASFLVEIDCGSDHPWDAPEQGCVIIP
jgi:hypothetical protein